MKLKPQKSIPSLRVKSAIIIILYSILLVSCSSHRYGAYFRDTSKSDHDWIESGMNTTVSDTKSLTFNSENTPLLATLNNVPMIQTDKDMQLNLAHKQVESAKALDQLNKNQLSKIEMKSIKRGIKEVVTKYRNANKSDNVNSVHEMPRYKYLTWAAGLFLAGILFVALSSSATFLGYLATIAFVAALVFFILWLVKK